MTMNLYDGCKVNIFIEKYTFPFAVGFTVSSAVSKSSGAIQITTM